MSELDPVLLKGLSAIEPYLGDVVIAGGWVPHIYELIYDAASAGRSPRTRDIDLAVPRSVPLKGLSIDQMLIAADFECRYRSLETPPVTRYVAIEGDGEIEIEFITDAPGSSEAVVSVQSDLTAQELHYVGLLLKDPWSVNLRDMTDGKADYAVQIPTPGAFVFHKALVVKDRRDKVKAEKDLYYMFFVLDAFPSWRGAIIAALREYAVIKSAWFKKCIGNLNAIFETPESDGVEAVLNQRPATAFPGMNDDQYRQYAFSVMSGLIEIMESALATAEE